MMNHKNKKIKFMEFPGDVDDDYLSNVKLSKNKTIIFGVLITIFFLFLFIFSSFLNERIVNFYFTK